MTFRRVLLVIDWVGVLVMLTFWNYECIQVNFNYFVLRNVIENSIDPVVFTFNQISEGEPKFESF